MIKKWLCMICKHNKHCQHNFDYECQEAYDHHKEGLPEWAIRILIKEASRKW